MKVMVVGSGGREHAIAWKLARDREVESIVCCPGNPGIAELATCQPVAPGDGPGLLSVCGERSIDLVVFGPEEPLVKGVGDWLSGNGVNVFGPSRGAARLEGSKGFAKLFMKRHKIPTGDFRIFDSYEDARESVRGLDRQVVVKADGLAAGKGVMICTGEREAEKALRAMMVERRFGAAGERVVIEEFIEGEEVSVMAICDGKDLVLLPCSKDHKRVFDGDKGPNTGGMGAVCPVPSMGQDLLSAVETTIMRRAMEGLSEEGTPYAGVLYAGLMLTAEGPKVLEFNCRFGDPEAQAVFPASQSDLGQVLFDASRGRLGKRTDLEANLHCVCVVVCSGGYPGRYEVGKEIAGLEKLRGIGDVVVFHAGTRRERDGLVTAGGRVLDVVGTGPKLIEASAKAYDSVRLIEFEGMHYRGDIGATSIRGRT